MIFAANGEDGDASSDLVAASSYLDMLTGEPGHRSFQTFPINLMLMLMLSLP